MPIKVSCHCGKVAIQVPKKPEFLNVCQCTNCRKHGVAWGYYEAPEVTFLNPKPSSEKEGTLEAGRGELEGVAAYMWRRRQRKYCYCEACGCMVYSWPMETETIMTVGVNMNCVDDTNDLEFVEKRITYEDLLT